MFDGPEDYRRRIEDPALNIDETCMLVVRGAGPIGFPGSAEVVNMTPPGHLCKRGVRMLPCMGDGRQSGTSESPSILNASPEAAIGGNLAILETGDLVKVDLRNAAGRRAAERIEEIERRREALKPVGVEERFSVAGALSDSYGSTGHGGLSRFCGQVSGFGKSGSAAFALVDGVCHVTEIRRARLLPGFAPRASD